MDASSDFEFGAIKLREINDLRKLRHVVGVARAGSFTSAASVLALTQSALTKSVAEVEHQLGLKLFERTSRGVRLTGAGESFVPRAERLLADAEDLLLDVRDVQMLAAGHIRIGAGPTAFVAFLESTLAAFARVYPAVTVTVEDGPEDRVVRSLLQGDLDLVVGSKSYFDAWRELETRSIAPLHLFFIARKDHPLSAEKKVQPQQLLSYPVVMPSAGLGVDQELRQAYAREGMSPVPPRYRCDHFSIVKGIVAATDAISPVLSLAPPADGFLKDYCVFADVVRFDPQELAVGFAKSREPSAAATAFLEIFRGFLADAAL